MPSVTRLVLPTLALAAGAAAFLEGYVTVTHVEEEVIFPGKINVAAIKGIMVAAVSDAEISACATADVVLSACVESGYLDEGAPTASARSCLCCYRGLTLSDEYSMCSTYIAASFPTETAAFTQVSLLNGICATGTCAPVATPTGIRTSGTGTVIPPPGCTSFVSVYQSCTSAVPGWSTLGQSKWAECLCYDRLGNFNTRFDDYASSCATWARTAVPSEYTVISALGDFCEINPPQTSTTRCTEGGAFGCIGTRPTTTAESTSFGATVTVTAPAPQGNAAGPAPAPGMAMWMGSFAAFALSLAWSP
ncbi:hypothetical protein QBC34DRAFT_379027 [Podospora aff. communis PSN243]|uniref:Uncharacterized protein n=1 Tax=Podospora aff. communis PSN243 TaxID=3040156 RepID=A0AAV9GQ83_9PEZI|nr:hypothetical protein QBC34DRAFT_379027 [Podospora aff. communis PSN243]